MLIEVMVLSSRQLFLTACYNPETASRVTLASLGTVFQTDYLQVTRPPSNKTIIQQNNKITKQQDNETTKQQDNENH